MKNNIIIAIIIAIIAMSFSSCTKEQLEFPQNNLVVEDFVIDSYVIGHTRDIDTVFDKFYPNNWNIQDYDGARLTIVEYIDTEIIVKLGDTLCSSFNYFSIRYNFAYSYITFQLFPYDVDPFDEDFYEENPEHWKNAKTIIFDDYVILTNIVHNKTQTIVMSYEDLEEIQETLISMDCELLL